MNAFHFSPKRLNRMIIWPLLFVLAACGTLEVGLEPGLEPDLDSAATFQPAGGGISPTSSPTIPPETTTPTPATVDLSNVFEFTEFLHPRLGYQIPVPNGTQIEQVENGRLTTFTYIDSSRVFVQQVELFSEIPGEVRDSAEAFLRWASGELEAPAAPIAIDNGRHQGAYLYVPIGAGTWCEEIREQIAAFVVQDQGYLIRIYSDAPERCNAENVPEISLIIDSVRLPAADATSLPEVGSDPDPGPTDRLPFLQVAYVKENNIWLWNETGETVALTKNGGVESLILSDDGLRIAFMRGGNIWVVNSDGSGERQLTHETDFENLSFSPDLEPLISGVSPYQMAWQPGSHKLFFNTVPLFAGPGLLLTDDLWSVDADQGGPILLLPPGEGGQFVISPDGQAVAVAKPGSIELVDSQGQNRRELFTHTPVITYSEFQYYLQPTWRADSQVMAVAVPPVDPMASPAQFTTIWSIPRDGTSPYLLGNIPAARGGQALFTPALDRVVYLVGDDSVMPATLQAAVSEIAEDSVGEPQVLPAITDSVTSWSPDGQHFVFAPPYDGVAGRRLASLDGSSQAIGDEGMTVFQVTWVDETRYLFLQYDGVRGWTIFLDQLDGDPPLPIDGVVGGPPAYAVNY